MHNFIYECSDYIKESDGNLLYKCLPQRETPVSKVKIRKRNYNNQIEELFDIAFQEENSARQRSLTAHTREVDCDNGIGYYVFPINGYDYLFNRQIFNLRKEYSDILEHISGESVSVFQLELLRDLLKNNYQDSNLIVAFEHACEIMFYNIPYYYAVEMEYFHNNQFIMTTISS